MSEPLGFSRDGDTITLRMTRDDFGLVMMALGIHAGSAEDADTSGPLFWSRIALANRLNVGNPDWTPYAIPEATT